MSWFPFNFILCFGVKTFKLEGKKTSITRVLWKWSFSRLCNTNDKISFVSVIIEVWCFWRKSKNRHDCSLKWKHNNNNNNNNTAQLILQLQWTLINSAASFLKHYQQTLIIISFSNIYYSAFVWLQIYSKVFVSL